MKCVLHIGTEKTGTTLLQEWLYANEAALSAQGIALTKTAGFPNNRKLVAYFQETSDDFLEKRQVRSEDQRKAFFAGFEEEFLAEIAELSKHHHTVVLTSEHFHSRLRRPGDLEGLRALLARGFSEIRVVCYFREQSQVRASLYSTALKNGETRRLRGFHNDVTPDNHYYNYLQFFSKWERAFGREALRPRLFDPEAFRDRDLRHDFLHAACPEADPGALSYEVSSANTSLTRKQAHFYRLLNIVQPPFAHLFANPLSYRLKDRLSQMDILKEGGTISDPRGAEMYRQFDESNRAFFARFFGTGENLFREPAVPAETDTEVGLETYRRVLFMILSTPGITFVTPQEVKTLRDVSTRLHEEGLISTQEAIDMLRVAQRARPEGEFLKAKLSELAAPRH